MKLPSGRVGGALSVFGVVEEVVRLPHVVLERDLPAVDDYDVITDVAY